MQNVIVLFLEVVSLFVVQKLNLHQQTNHGFVMFFQVPISDRDTV